MQYTDYFKHLNEESDAAKAAHAKGLKSSGWGRWKDSSGKDVARTVGGKLVMNTDASKHQQKTVGHEPTKKTNYDPEPIVPKTPPKDISPQAAANLYDPTSEPDWDEPDYPYDEKKDDERVKRMQAYKASIKKDIAKTDPNVDYMGTGERDKIPHPDSYAARWDAEQKAKEKKPVVQRVVSLLKTLINPDNYQDGTDNSQKKPSKTAALTGKLLTKDLSNFKKKNPEGKLSDYLKSRPRLTGLLQKMAAGDPEKERDLNSWLGN